jgi:hypothetical protein
MHLIKISLALLISLSAKMALAIEVDQNDFDQNFVWQVSTEREQARCTDAFIRDMKKGSRLSLFNMPFAPILKFSIHF